MYHVSEIFFMIIIPLNASCSCYLCAYSFEIHHHSIDCNWINHENQFDGISKMERIFARTGFNWKCLTIQREFQCIWSRFMRSFCWNSEDLTRKKVHFCFRHYSLFLWITLSLSSSSTIVSSLNLCFSDWLKSHESIIMLSMMCR